MADGDDLVDHFVHLGHINNNIRGIVSTKHHQIHGFYPHAIVGFKHISIEILLDAVVIEGRIGQRDTIEALFATESLHHRLA